MEVFKDCEEKITSDDDRIGKMKKKTKFEKTVTGANRLNFWEDIFIPFIKSLLFK